MGGISRKMTLCIYSDVSSFSASFQFKIYVKHILGKYNQLADALLRNNLRLFQELRLTVTQSIPIPPQLVEYI